MQCMPTWTNPLILAKYVHESRCNLIQNIVLEELLNIGSCVFFSVFNFLARVVMPMPSSHRRRAQDKTVMSCPRLRCERVRDSLRQFSVVLNILETEQFCPVCLRCERLSKLVLTQFN